MINAIRIIYIHVYKIICWIIDNIYYYWASMRFWIWLWRALWDAYLNNINIKWCLNYYIGIRVKNTTFFPRDDIRILSTANEFCSYFCIHFFVTFVRWVSLHSSIILHTGDLELVGPSFPRIYASPYNSGKSSGCK